MQRYRWDQMEEEALAPLLARKVIHGQNMTVARIRLAKDAVVPAHSHVNEQITMLLEGALRFILEGREVVLRAGDILEIPPHAEHRVEALEDAVAIDLFAPMRDDWARGDDAYLRQPR